MNPNENAPDIRMDTANLYREETFTDNAVGTLRRLTPVTADGETDPARPVQFVGTTQVLTTAGPLPLSFEIEAASLTEAARTRRASSTCSKGTRTATLASSPILRLKA